MNGVREGCEFFCLHAPGVIAAESMDSWITAVSDQIEDAVEDLLQFEGSKKGIDFLSGDVMEFWHADTANIDAAVKRLDADFTVPRSTGFGTPDIVRESTGQMWQVKYGKDAEASAKYQSVTYSEASHKGSPTAKALIDSGAVGEHDSVYGDMDRIIPEGQLDEAKQFSKNRMLKNRETRPELVDRDQKFLDHAADRIETEDGVRSVGMDRAGSKELALDIRDGKFDPEKYGLTLDDWIKARDVLKESAKAGMTAAIISAVLAAAPEVIKAIEYLVETGELDLAQVKATGAAAVTGGAKGFLIGAVSTAAIGFCEKGLLGEALQDANPSVVAAVAVVAVNAIFNGIQIACGKKSGREFVDELARDSFVAACALIGGGISQHFIEIPVFGYMVGSFVGSVVGSVAYSAGKQITVALCVESGFTMFGLVEQDYTLPDSVFREIGAHVFEYDCFAMNEFQEDTMQFSQFSFDSFSPDTFGITPLRRGVFGVARVAYVE